MLKAIRRLDIALAYSLAGLMMSSVLLFVVILFAVSLVVTGEHIEVVALLALNAILGCLSVGLFVFWRRGVRNLRSRVNEAKSLMKATGAAIEGPLSVAPDGIVAKGWRGRKTTIKWDDISAVTYDKGEICFLRKDKLIGFCYWTNYLGLPFDLKIVAEAITRHLPEDRWSKAKEWLNSQIREDMKKGV